MRRNIRSLQTSYGAGSNPTGNPIGGGAGYTNIITSSQANYVVSTLSQLINALASATVGQIVYVVDSASIDMSGQKDIVIPGGVTLASGRGNAGSNGALLFTNTTTSTDAVVYGLFRVGGSGVRVTGIRIQGRDPTVGSQIGYCCADAGIDTSYSNLEVDNCEISGWAYSGVLLYPGATGTYVHHCYIHNNQHDGLGYGIAYAYAPSSTTPLDLVAEANIFEANRHSISSGGTQYSSYEARYNIVHAGGSAFDVHPDSTCHAGGWTKVHHNTFDYTDAYGVSLRGEPYYGAEIHNNWFYQTGSDTNENGLAVYLTDTTCNRVYTSAKATIIDNWYGATPPPSTCISLTSCSVTCPSNITQGNSANISLSWSGGQSPFSLQLYRDALAYGTPVSAAASPVTMTLTTDTSWTIGNHSVYVKITDSCSTGVQTCNTNTCTINVTSQIPVTPMLLGYWKFDEGSGTTSADSSGNGNTANLVNSPVWATGIVGRCLQLNGTNYAEILKSSSLDSINSSMTITAWINTPLTSITPGTIIERWLYSPNPERSYVLTIETDGSVRFVVSADGLYPPAGTGDLASSRKLVANTWTHIAAISDGTTMKIYINGQQDINTITAPAGIRVPNSNLHIGAWQYTTTPDITDYFNGSIDEVKLFNYALTPAQVLNDYSTTACSPPTISFTMA